MLRQATLPLRSRMSPHITLNPYSTQLVDNINRMMAGGHIYQVAQVSPQLSQLTNTQKKKKCVGGHSGPCLHSLHSDTWPALTWSSGLSVLTGTSIGRLTRSGPTNW